jgi:hypothetical protein
VVVETAELDAVWQTTDDAVTTMSGTPFGPLVTGLPLADPQRVRGLLAGRLGESVDGTLTVRTTSNIGRGIK